PVAGRPGCRLCSRAGDGRACLHGAARRGETVFRRLDEISGCFFTLLPKTGNVPKFLLYCTGKGCIISTLGIPGGRWDWPRQ
ncbi:Helix-turn-helix conjugative transposon-like domain-containing protein, partial [Dysosmobacter welbionis]